MPRSILPEDQIHPGVREKVGKYHATIVDEVKAAIAAHDIVVVGMAMNPHPRRARKALKQRGLAHHYLEYGSYFGSWRRRNALKMWTGWPTFPMCFHKGVLVGGADELIALLESGALG